MQTITNSNVGCRWTDAEEKQLLGEIQDNIPLEMISVAHGRTIRGITSRLEILAYKMFRDNIKIEDIQKATHLKRDQILDAVEVEKQKQEKSKIKEKNYGPKENNEVSELKDQVARLQRQLDELYKIFGFKYCEEIVGKIIKN